MSAESLSLAEQIQTYIHVELRNQLGSPDFATGDDLLTTGLVDSLSIMRLIGHLEQTFDRRIPQSDVTIENFLTCETIAEYLSQEDGHNAANRSGN